MRNNIVKFKSAATSAAGKVAAGAAALVASGAALAGGGAASPGAAIAGELAGGKSDIMLIIGAVAVLLGALIVWAYVKRAK